MIIPFSLNPEAKNKKARFVFTACLGSAVIAIILSGFMDKYRGIVGLFILAFFTAAIFVYNKYMASVYTYEVTMADNGEALFVIGQRQGRRYTTLCRVGLASVISVDTLNKDQLKAYKADRTIARYSYHPTMSPDELCLIKVRSSYEKADVFVELPEEYAKRIMDYSAIARANELMDEE